jgi:HSP20 family protein
MSLNRDINRLFDDLLQPSALPTMADTAVATALITPQINVSETDTEIRVTAELPGVDLDDLEVDVMDDMLVIRGEKALERSDEDENYHFVECAYGSFQRTVQLPFAADPDQVQASFENAGLAIAALDDFDAQPRFLHLGSGGRGSNTFDSRDLALTDRTHIDGYQGQRGPLVEHMGTCRVNESFAIGARRGGCWPRSSLPLPIARA